MSIKPIDHNVMIPKVQDLANNKQTENLKNRNIVESQFIQQKKINKNNRKKVLNTEKTIYNKIKDEGKSNNKEKSNKEENKEEKNKGSSIDIRI